jgi:hypothetical protein
MVGMFVENLNFIVFYMEIKSILFQSTQILFTLDSNWSNLVRLHVD